MDKTILVKSVNGKAIHLVDAHTPHPDNSREFFFLAISEKEAKAGKSKEVPSNQFWHNAIANGLIAQGEKPERKPRVEKPKVIKPEEVKDEKI